MGGTVDVGCAKRARAGGKRRWWMRVRAVRAGSLGFYTRARLNQQTQARPHVRPHVLVNRSAGRLWRANVYNVRRDRVGRLRPTSLRTTTFPRVRQPSSSLFTYPSTLHLLPMAPKPASTAGKAPASTASKAPAKTTSEGSKAAKKTKAAAAPADGEKKKRRKVRKETYSSYIYKGARRFAICHPHPLS
jgi:hypothetical protein